MKSFLKENYLLFLIIFLAISLRFYKLSTIPIGFSDDEAAFGYNAYSILKTGKDEWGRLLPFPVFESFGDWKLSFYLYLTVVSQFFFGFNEFATRFPSALFGVLAVIATFFLSKELFDKKVALVAAVLVAISPWHIVASRNAFESDLLSFFITLGLYFFLKSFRQRKLLYISTILFTACFYVYRSSWLFVPLFVLVLILLFREQFQKSKEFLLKNLALSVILLIPLVSVVLTFKGQSRFVQESFILGVARQGIINEVNENRGQCLKRLPQLTCIMLYNKYNYFLSTYIANYFGNLSYKTFFEKANPTGFQSFATRSTFYLFEIPFLLIGILAIFKQKDHSPKILLAWLVLAPIGAAFAGIGNYGRLNIIIPAPQIVTAFGLVLFLKLFKNASFASIAKFSFFSIVIFSAIKLSVDISMVEPYQISRYQRYGYKQLFVLLESLKYKDYDHFYISKKIDNSHQYIHYLYFQKVDPRFYLENVKRYRGNDGWIMFESVGRYKFVSSVPGLEKLPPKSLVIVGEKEVSFPAVPIFTINDLRGDPIFEAHDIDKVKEELLKNNEKF